jgi:hypothetical protein
MPTKRTAKTKLGTTFEITTDPFEFASYKGLIQIKSGKLEDDLIGLVRSIFQILFRARDELLKRFDTRFELSLTFQVQNANEFNPIEIIEMTISRFPDNHLEPYIYKTTKIFPIPEEVPPYDQVFRVLRKIVEETSVAEKTVMTNKGKKKKYSANLEGCYSYTNSEKVSSQFVIKKDLTTKRKAEESIHDFVWAIRNLIEEFKQACVMDNVFNGMFERS